MTSVTGEIPSRNVPLSGSFNSAKPDRMLASINRMNRSMVVPPFIDNTICKRYLFGWVIVPDADLYQFSDNRAIVFGTYPERGISMSHEWKTLIASLEQITVTSTDDNEPVTIRGEYEGFTCVGIGTDAAVFRSPDDPEVAFKVYASTKADKAEAEARVYEALGESSYFPRCYGTYGNILVLSFESGITLFDCVLQGVHIPKRVVDGVEEAREYVRSVGLNPRDIHLKNILLQDGRAKIVDVSEYILEGNDYRWEHLKKGYDEFYSLIDGRAIPFWVVETVRKWYHQWVNRPSTIEDFMAMLSKFIPFNKQ